MEPFAYRTAASESERRAPGLLNMAPWSRFEGLTAGFSTRLGGGSLPPRDGLNTALHVGDDEKAVIANRRAIAEALGWPFEAWTCAEQVHGSRVVRVTDEERGMGGLSRESAIQDADALITDEPDILLAMYFADCVPLYFYDPEHGALGLAHAGWKGTAADVAKETIRAMRDAFGTAPSDLYASIGPAIGVCCFEVDDIVKNRVLVDVPEDARFHVPSSEGKYRLNLKEINKHLMIKAGILPSRIEMSGWCTSCSTDLFFSHRKERGQTGRMMSWLGKKK
ncbi:peptidoglycan editing factor PgeF [Cohnella rhizosphaerae]|uniref:Purine nucleoside phosphorylase n=1 Tax=Cohnella rhizosphaerae TaxID=1457232 RepID=A0A9X4L295_9BACL|nr:peptidoglycan editing factor PgeF [Cohnella rhizosphaerae]MDG0812212.1 peptidoglycan editing factor PgeF [Cohnella rhizosphaerae]